MKATRNLASCPLLCIVLLFFYSCDYYESPIPVEEESISKPLADTSNKTTTLSDEDRITLYEVKGEDIIKIQDYEVTGELLDFQKDTAKHQEIWELTKKIIPLSYRLKMSEFLIYHGAASKTSGFVDPTINNLSKWQFAIAIDYAYRKEFNSDGEVAFTIIHEFGHILTLNDEQINAGVIPDNCTNYYVSKGCAKTDAFINVFQNRYWSDIWDEYTNQAESREAKLAFYEKYRDRYVSEYAATKPQEDIAEVFATFVVGSDRAEGNSIAEQKIEMMYEAQELIDLRDFIRKNSLAAKSLGFLPVGKQERKTKCLTAW